MPGNKNGGKKAAETNIQRHGEDFYKRIGVMGGSARKTKPAGFAYAAAHGLTWHKEAGRKGGLISKRPKKSYPAEGGMRYEVTK